MATAPRLGLSLAGAAMTAAGVYYLGNGSLGAAAGGATAVFLVLFLRLQRADA